MESVFGHHGTQDLGDWFGRFGFEPHGAVDGHQVQSGSREVNVSTDTDRTWDIQSKL